MFILSPWAKVLILACAALLIVLTLVVVLCVVGPGCYVYEHLNREEIQRKKKRVQLSVYGTADSKIELRDLAVYENGGHGSFHKKSTGLQPPDGHAWVERSSLLSEASSFTKRDSTYSSMSNDSGRTSPTTCSYQSSTVGESPTGDRDRSQLGQVTFTLQFVPSANSSGRLHIGLEEAHDLPHRLYRGSVDPYFMVVMVRDRRSIRRKQAQTLFEFRSKTVRHTQNPCYNQNFVADVTKTDLKDCHLKLTAIDQDRHANSTELGSTTLHLRDVKQLPASEEKILLTYYLTDSHNEYGEVLLGLSFLPTAKRISFNIMKASNLCYQYAVDSLEKFNPYVRVIMLNKNGREIKKKKTTFKRGTNAPVFNETLNFDMQEGQLRSVTFLLTVCNKRIKDLTSQEIQLAESSHSSDPESPVTQLPTEKRKDICMGKVALGMHVLGAKEKKHWDDMVTSQRKVISQWHTLK